ncbi:MAG: hypothetical protein ACODAG_08610, partial [Myxococcota bacterium]
MGRRKKRNRSAEQEPPSPPRAPERINRPFEEALRGVRPEQEQPTGRRPIDTLPPPGPSPREPVPSTPPEPAGGPASRDEDPAPPPAHSYEDRVAFSQAFADVQPLARRQRGRAGEYVTEPHLR